MAGSAAVILEDSLEEVHPAEALAGLRGCNWKPSGHQP